MIDTPERFDLVSREVSGFYVFVARRPDSGRHILYSLRRIEQFNLPSLLAFTIGIGEQMSMDSKEYYCNKLTTMRKRDLKLG